jgi:Caspase domain
LLKPDKTRPGLWVNDAWTDGSPGTFAIIIGVSRYRNLDGSRFGLDQLFVSATTAFGFFTWLEGQYRRTGSPLAKCWLLLSPTPEEIAESKGLDAHVAEPTFANCEKAIQEWKLEMLRLPLAAAPQSRSVFFFSGHGLEIIEDRQILLPLDYMDPGTPIDRALSTQNISRGLKALPIPLHFLFVDACRNDHNNLGNYAPLEGRRVLDEPANSAINPDSFVPIFYGSAAGTQAMQPKDPKKFSIFGQALLDGLSARGLQPDCESGTCCIFLHHLRPFVGNRIKEILRTEYNQTSSQRVRVRGDQTEEPITEVAPPPKSPPRAGGPSGQPSPGAPPGPPPVGIRPTEVFEASVPASLQAIRPTTAAWEDVHVFFGSEQITDLWMNRARVFDYSSMTWLDKGVDIQVAGLKRSQDNTVLQFNLMVPGAKRGDTYWLQIEDSVQAQAFVLPMDRSAISVFRVEMDFQFSPPVIKRFDVSLSVDNQGFVGVGFLGIAARLWDVYNKESANQALRAVGDIFLLHADELEGVLLHKVQSPLAAAIAGTVLLRGRRWDKLHNWLRNLANLAPEIPDGAVLWAEQCLRQPDAKSRDQAIEYFLRLGSSSLPFLAEPTGYALRQAEDFLNDPACKPLRDKIEGIHKRLVRAVGMFRPGGLFATFAGPAAELSPRILTPIGRVGAASASANT